MYFLIEKGAVAETTNAFGKISINTDSPKLWQVPLSASLVMTLSGFQSLLIRLAVINESLLSF